MSSFGRGLMGSPCWVGVSSLAHLSMASSGAVMSWVGAAPVAQFSSGPSGGQGRGGACRSKRLVGGQHVPDRFGEATADLDGGDLGASLAAVTLAHALPDRCVAGIAGGGVCGFDERPAQVVGTVLAQRAAPVAFAGLLDAWAEAGVAGQLARRREAVDVADLGGDREASTEPIPGQVRSRGMYGWSAPRVRPPSFALAA